MRIRLLTRLALPVVLALLAGAAGAAEKRPPNVIILMVDTLRADHLGSYGFPGKISPAMDRFAKQGVLFERCATPAPWTKPAVTSLFTSLHTETHQNFHARMEGKEIKHVEVLPPDVVTMAELFKKRGYRTAGLIANPWIRPESGLAQGFDTYTFFQRMEAMDRATAWIVKYATASAKPLFLYIHVIDVHGHYLFNDADFAEMRKALDPALDRTLTDEEIEGLQWYMKATFKGDKGLMASVLNWRAAYAAGVRRFDRRFARMMTAVRKTGLLDDSIFVLTSDHGEGLMQHGSMEHGKTLHIEELHVPLIMRLPNGRYRGRRVPDWVSLVDVLPTLAELCGVDARPAHPQGESLVRQMKGRRFPGRAVFTHAMMMNDSQRSVLRGDLHLIMQTAPPIPPRLYDFEKDRAETDNLAPRRSDDVRALTYELVNHLAAQAAGPDVGRSEMKMTDEMKEQLRSLGYLQ